MREIKFRVRHKTYKKMHTYFKVKFGKSVNITLDGKFKDVDHITTKTVPNKELEIMQYTGLKDKNGVEIYEGDIINCYEYGHIEPSALVVGFTGGGFMLYNPNCCVHCKNQKGCVCSLLESCYESYEIIGNLHQNPELVKLD